MSKRIYDQHTRISLHIIHADRTTLRRLMRALGLSAPTQLITRAIRAFAMICDAQERGDTVLIRAKDGQETHIILL